MLVPFARVHIATSKPAPAVREALRAAIDGDVGMLPWLAPWTGRHLAGTVTDSWFRLVSRTRFRNFFLPVTEGDIRVTGGETIIAAVIRPKLTEIVACVGALVLMGVLTLAHGHTLWGVAIMGMIIYGAGCLRFASGQERVMETLQTAARVE